MTTSCCAGRGNVSCGAPTLKSCSLLIRQGKEGLYQIRAMSIGASVRPTSFPTAEWWRAVFTNGEGYHISGIRWTLHVKDPIWGS